MKKLFAQNMVFWILIAVFVLALHISSASASSLPLAATVTSTSAAPLTPDATVSATRSLSPTPGATATRTTSPSPTLVPGRTPNPTLAPIGEIQEVPSGYVYLGDKETLALGFNMTAGGALGSLLFNGTELVDDTDYGRYIQLSMYDGNDTYGALGNDPYGNWGWNPIQAGSKAGGSSIIGAKVLEYRTAPASVYIKSLGKEWGQYDQDSDVIYETWAFQRDDYFEVHIRATHTARDSHASYTQEFPAAYFHPSLTRMWTFLGDAPFTGAPITRLDHVAGLGDIAGTGNCPAVSPTENWAALTNSDLFGLVLAVPPQQFLGPKWNICLLYDQPPVGYIGPVAYFDVPPRSVRELTYYLIPGSIEAARSKVYDLIPHTTWTFDLGSLEGWQSNSDRASVTDGINSVILSPEDWLTSRGDLLIPTVISSVLLKARTGTANGRVCLEWTTTDSGWSPDQVECLNVLSGDFQQYEFPLAKNPAWRDKIVTQLRLSAETLTQLDIDSIAVHANGYAWEFEGAGDSEGWVPWNNLEPLTVKNGLLSSVARGLDPYMHSPGILVDAAATPLIEIRMAITAGGEAQIFFMTEGDTDFVESKSLIFSPNANGQFHTYTLDMSKVKQWQGLIKQLRFDPTNDRAKVDIDYIRVLSKE